MALPRRAVAPALLLALAATSQADAASQPTATVQLKTPAAKLTAVKRISVRLTGLKTGRVKLTTSLRADSAAAASKVARTRTIRVTMGRTRVVGLTLTPKGIAALKACGTKRLMVTARPKTGNATSFTLGVGTACGSPAPAPVTATPTTTDDTIALRASRFWDGPTMSGNVLDGSACTDATCPTYPLKLAAGGKRLRVALDTPSREDNWQIQLLDPTGTVVATKDISNQFNEEAFVTDPAAGLWKVRILPKGATDAVFRLRVKLESAEDLVKPTGHVPMLPNLRTVPPYEFGFVAPANPANAAYPSDAVNPPASAGGVAAASCAADETAPVAAGGGGAVKCLRLTSGPINVGDGPFDMRFRFAQDSMNDPNVALVNGPIHQAVHYADNQVVEHDAGTYSFHKTHAHFHDDHILDYKLFKPGGATGTELIPAGVGTKSGFCPADQLFGQWETFTQEKSGYFGDGDSVSGGSCYSPNDGFIGLTKGWGDVYRWQRPGQYVEFGTNGDGLYVVQTSVDILNQIQELDDSDNVSYAYIKVVGTQVQLLERGRGQSPWDPGKVVFHGAGPASLT